MKTKKRILAAVMSVLMVLVTNVGIMPASAVVNAPKITNYSDWTRSLESEVSQYTYQRNTGTGGWTYDNAKLMKMGETKVWDQGHFFNDYSTRKDIEWASWKQYEARHDDHSVNLRLFKNTFTIPDNESVTSAKIGTISGGNFVTTIPVNDNIFVYVNGKPLFHDGTSFSRKQNGSSTSGPYRHTDGWYVEAGSLDFKADLHSGVNTVEVFAEENATGGGMSKLSLQVQTLPIIYTLNYAAGTGGSISGANPQNVLRGTNGTPVTAVANQGYDFINWSDGVTTPTRTESNVLNNISVTANFAIKKFTLTYTAGANGSISGISPQTVNYGTNGAAVTAVPNTGYKFVKWSDNVTTATRADLNVIANKSVSASFAVRTFTLNYLANAHGSIVGVSPQTVEYGKDGLSVAAVPNLGYHFSGWSDGKTNATRTDLHVMDDISATASFDINQYTLTYTAGAHGSINGTSPQTVNHGQDGTQVTAVPDTGYVFVGWDDGKIGELRTDTNVQGNISVTAIFVKEIEKFTLTYIAGTHGSITGVPSQIVESGNDGSEVTATAGPGYHFTGWSDGVTTASRQDKNVLGNITVTANFAIDQFTLTYSALSNGSISGTTPQTVDRGTSGTPVIAVPNTGYHFVTWSDDVTTAARTDSNVTNNINVTASFAINHYVLTYTAEENGTITGTTPQTVDHGLNGAEVTATPKAGYHFVKWSDGVLTAARTDAAVQGDITVSASFAINQFKLSYTAEANGTLTGTALQTVDNGKDGTLVTAVANDGYHFVSWSDGVLTAARTDTEVTKDITVAASFAINQYALSYIAGENGSISGVALQTVNHGANGTQVTAVADPGSHFVSWSDGNLEATRTDYEIVKDKTFTASFAINKYTLSYSANENGTISGVSPQTVNHGSDGTEVIAVPNEGFHFVSWSDELQTAARTDKNVTGDKNVTASFAINEYVLNYLAGPNGTVSGTTPQTLKHNVTGSAVTAVPNSGYHFVGWSDGVTTTTRKDIAKGNFTVTANFAGNESPYIPTPTPIRERIVPDPTLTPTPIPTATPTPTTEPIVVATPVPTVAPTPTTVAVIVPDVIPAGPPATPVPTSTPEPTPIPTPEPTPIPIPTAEPTPIPTEEPVVLDNIETPGGAAKLPKTGGVPAEVFYGFGAGLIALGAIVRKVSNKQTSK